MFWRLVTVADDFGRFEADPRILLSHCFPLRVNSLKLRQISTWFKELEACNLVQSYVINSKQLAFFTTWDTHQQKRAKYSKYPEPDPASICNQMQTDDSICLREARVEIEKREASNTSHLKSDEWGSATQLFELYNTLTPDECPAIITYSPARIDKAKKYLRLFPKKEFWEEVFGEVHKSEFLRGLKNSNGHEGFICNFDWLLTKGKDGTENCVKVNEGRYRQ